MSDCPACGDHLFVCEYDGGQRPLNALNLPKTKAESLTVKTFPFIFQRCLTCKHVFNPSFKEDDVNYVGDTNRMYNGGECWREHLNEVGSLVGFYGAKSVIDVGCGDGHFRRHISPYIGYTGYDIGDYEGPDVKIEYFNSQQACDMVIARHLIEHVVDPLRFIQSITHQAKYLLVEVPHYQGCVDDLIYEHVQNFTKKSLRCLLQQLGTVMEVKSMYNDEVLVGIVCINPDWEEFGIWGGTGKALTFINNNYGYLMHIPFVVDSDKEKEGFFVPGHGWEIVHINNIPDSVKYVVVATPWRRPDIENEIKKKSLKVRIVDLVAS
jgi:SAM-dependent methyltransferase